MDPSELKPRKLPDEERRVTHVSPSISPINDVDAESSSEQMKLRAIERQKPGNYGLNHFYIQNQPNQPFNEDEILKSMDRLAKDRWLYLLRHSPLPEGLEYSISDAAVSFQKQIINQEQEEKGISVATIVETIKVGDTWYEFHDYQTWLPIFLDRAIIATRLLPRDRDEIARFKGQIKRSYDWIMYQIKRPYKYKELEPTQSTPLGAKTAKSLWTNLAVGWNSTDLKLKTASYLNENREGVIIWYLLNQLMGTVDEHTKFARSMPAPSILDTTLDTTQLPRAVAESENPKSNEDDENLYYR